MRGAADYIPKYMFTTHLPSHFVYLLLFLSLPTACARSTLSATAKALLRHFFIGNILFTQFPLEADEDDVDPDRAEGSPVAHSDDLFVALFVNPEAGAATLGAFDCACACAAQAAALAAAASLAACA
ncbi:hypothetical protein K457DRAFT_159172 [Linnemannia elongata AG-77]|uniref:Secreted protein n=1 Tax=Linnemannia elongata AG-77 TaxID=1314771 RepID=A0A197JEZ4_9FUNG|nr:hypothetical protein K457DRAFT_159172 [Linnemannia elongata AG-77]